MVNTYNSHTYCCETRLAYVEHPKTQEHEPAVRRRPAGPRRPPSGPFLDHLFRPSPSSRRGADTARKTAATGERQQQEGGEKHEVGRRCPANKRQKKKKTASEKVTEIRRVYVEPIYVFIRKEEGRPSRARSAPQTDNNVK